MSPNFMSNELITVTDRLRPPIFEVPLDGGRACHVSRACTVAPQPYQTPRDFPEKPRIQDKQRKHLCEENNNTSFLLPYTSIG